MASSTALLLLFVCSCVSGGDYRLSTAVVPIRYKLTISLEKNFVKTRRFHGNLELLVNITTETVEIALNALGLTYSKWHVYKGDKVESENEILTKLTNKAQYERIGLKASKGESYPAGPATILLEFMGNFSNDSTGFYLNSYKQHDTKLWFAATRMEPIYARRVFPCFDEPHFKTPFHVVLKYPRTYRAISNEEEELRKAQGDFYESTFKPTPKLSTFAVAFVVCQFSDTSIMNGMVYSVWSQSNLQPHVQYSMNITPDILNEFSNVTGVPLKTLLHKLDQVAVPDMIQEGMHNWGLMIYSESYFILDDPMQSSLYKQFVWKLQIHMLSHIWFGNLRTSKWWNNYWLNDGIAAFMQCYILDKIVEWSMMDQFVVAYLQTVLHYHSHSSVTELSVSEDDTLTPSQIINSVDNRVNYFLKGSSLIRMMMFFMGEELFLKGLRRYMSNEYIPHFSPVVPNDLWNAWNKESKLKKILPKGRTLNDVMNSWTTVKGLPIVYVNRVDNKVQLRAERLISNPKPDTSGGELASRHYVPITYVTHDKGEFTDLIVDSDAWIHPDGTLEIEEDLRDENAWIVVNLQSSACIRVRYDDELWKKIEKTLKTDLSVIHPLNRAQIVDDAFNLARAGKMSYKQTFDIVQYLEEEIDYYPWIAAAKGFDFLLRKFDTEPNVAKTLKLFTKRLVKKVYDAVEKMEKSTNHIGKVKYDELMYWACHVGYRKCLHYADKQFDRLYSKNKRVRPDRRHYVYCVGIHESVDNREWEFMYTKMRTTQIESERRTIISALGCSPHAYLLTLYLERSISPKSGISKFDSVLIFESVISNTPGGLQVALTFLSKNYETIKKYHSGKDLARIIGTLAENLRTTVQLVRFKAFLEATDLDKYTIKSALDICNENLAWVDAKKAELIVYLRDYLKTEKKKSNAMATAASSFTLFSTLIIYYY